MISRRFFTAAVVAGLMIAAPLAARAAVEVDLTSPKSAARTFGQGMSQGDIEAVKASAIATAEQQKALEALSAVVSNFKKVEEAAIAKFGETAGKTVASQQQMSIGEELEKIDSATETITGDTAVLAAEGSQEPLHLRKVDGQWKVDFAAMPGTEQVAQAIPMITAMAGAADELAAEITADKYKTADEAKNALGQKMMAAMMSMQMPENGQTTEPSQEDSSSGMDADTGADADVDMDAGANESDASEGTEMDAAPEVDTAPAATQPAE